VLLYKENTAPNEQSLTYNYFLKESTLNMNPAIGLIKDFLEFLSEYKVIGLAIGVIIGIAATALVKSCVDNLIMPFVTLLTPTGDWKTATLDLGPVHLGIGPFAAELLNFIIIAFVVFIIAKVIMGEGKVTKK